jgi:hypothetical protein
MTHDGRLKAKPRKLQAARVHALDKSISQRLKNRQDLGTGPRPDSLTKERLHGSRRHNSPNLYKNTEEVGGCQITAGNSSLTYRLHI